MTSRERTGPHHLSGSHDGDGNDVESLDELRHRGPVTWSDRHGWMVLGHREAFEVLHDHETYSNQVSRHLSVPQRRLLGTLGPIPLIDLAGVWPHPRRGAHRG